MQKVGKPYASKRSAQAYAEREWTGEHVSDRAQWRIEIRQETSGEDAGRFWCWIEEAK